MCIYWNIHRCAVFTCRLVPLSDCVTIFAGWLVSSYFIACYNSCLFYAVCAACVYPAKHYSLSRENVYQILNPHSSLPQYQCFIQVQIYTISTKVVKIIGQVTTKKHHYNIDILSKPILVHVAIGLDISTPAWFTFRCRLFDDASASKTYGRFGKHTGMDNPG